MALVVVGVDGSAGGAAAVRFAAEEAGLRGARLRVVSVWHLPQAVYAGGFAPGDGVSEGLEEAARQVASEAADSARSERSGIEVEVRVAHGVAAQVLIEESRDADLLVVGSRGLGGFRSLLLGSVSHQLAQHSACPVVIVPAGGGSVEEGRGAA